MCFYQRECRDRDAEEWWVIKLWKKKRSDFIKGNVGIEMQRGGG